MPFLLRGVASQIARKKATTSASSSIKIASTLRLQHPGFPLPQSSLHLLTRSISHTHRALSPSAPMAAETDTIASSLASSENITPETLSSKLRTQLNLTHVSIVDMSGGCGQAFTAVIVSPDFEKKTLLARHRLVNGALKDEIAAIHAWTPRCLTPAQWDAEKQKEGGA